nr:putative RING-H2 finger protein ATL21A [Ipomoea batatas]
MAIFQALLLFLISSLLIHAMAGDCQSSSCSEGGVSVRFPFGLENQPSFMSCAYNPLFSLKCSTSNSNSSSSSSSSSQQRSPVPVVFNLPSSGDFFVRKINYLKQEIQLYDPSNCLPKRFLKLDLSFSPFKALNYSNYTFLRCPKHVVKQPSSSVIDCLSNSTVSVLATSSMSVVRAMNMCEPLAANLSVPVSQSEHWFSSHSDFRLRWSAPDCRWCEAQGGVCAFAPFADYTIQDLGCSFDNATTPSEMEMETGWTSPIPQPTMSSSSSLRNSMAPTSTNTTTHQTLLYTPKVFEDSERLPRPGEISCAICRDKYVAQERLGLVNGCQHSFHAHCLQSWLDTSPTCPLCRISLSSIPTSF